MPENDSNSDNKSGPPQVSESVTVSCSYSCIHVYLGEKWHWVISVFVILLTQVHPAVELDQALL